MDPRSTLQVRVQRVHNIYLLYIHTFPVQRVHKIDLLIYIHSQFREYTRYIYWYTYIPSSESTQDTSTDIHTFPVQRVHKIYLLIYIHSQFREFTRYIYWYTYIPISGDHSKIYNAWFRSIEVGSILFLFQLLTVLKLSHPYLIMYHLTVAGSTVELYPGGFMDLVVYMAKFRSPFRVLLDPLLCWQV